MMVFDQSVAPPVILVVEDEMLPRMRAIDMVEDAGYTSVEAVDADEALAVLESRSDIALLLTDIQMPGSMDGLKLAHAVRKRWPPIKIILVSGQLKSANIDIPANSSFLEKPLEAKKILAQMRRLLGDERH
jgi:CheY-like chemotaxis protein